MRIGILHGYGLWGSGSNLYVNRLSQQLSRTRTQVHVFAQERAAKLPKHIRARTRYGASAAERADNPDATPASAVELHVPNLGPVLPVYNWDHYPDFDDVREIVTLGDDELEAYVASSAASVAQAVREHDIELLHANHMVAMPEVARRVQAQTGCPFVITPHGSAIEYAVRKDPRLQAMGAAGLAACSGLVLGGEEMVGRLEEVFGSEATHRPPHRVVPMGVDLEAFAPRRRPHGACPDVPCPGSGGASRALMQAFTQQAREGADVLNAAAEVRPKYHHQSTDSDVAETLRRVAWGRRPVGVFAGKLVSGKGVHNLIVGVAEAQPDMDLLIVGEGPTREPLELLFSALIHADHGLFCRVVEHGWAFDAKPPAPWHHLMPYLAPARFERLARQARDYDLGARVHFLGYMPHETLATVARQCDLAVLASIVPEAYPLALVEALAMGLRPVATAAGGAGSFLRDVGATMLPAERPFIVSLDGDALPGRLGDALATAASRATGPLASASTAVADRGWPATAQTVRDIYQSVLTQDQARS